MRYLWSSQFLEADTEVQNLKSLTLNYHRRTCADRHPVASKN